MSWNDYEYSKYDSIIEETINKIKTEIETDIKSEIEDQLLWEERYDSACDTIEEYQRENDSLRNEINILNKKLEQKQKYKYNIGDEIYIVVRDTSVSKTYKCPTCEGKGKVKAKDFDENFPFDIEIECPVCRNRAPGCNYKDEKYGNSYRTEYTYEGRTVHRSLITGINLTENNSYSYQIKSLVWNTYNWYKEEEVFLTKDLALKKVKEYTSNRENEIAKYIGPKWGKESK